MLKASEQRKSLLTCLPAGRSLVVQGGVMKYGGWRKAKKKILIKHHQKFFIV